MQDWLKALISALTATAVGALTGMVRHIWLHQQEQAKRQQSVEEGLQALLYDRIYRSYTDCIRKEFATADDIRNLENLYRPYHALGGNGTGTELFERVKKMPNQPKVKKST